MRFGRALAWPLPGLLAAGFLSVIVLTSTQAEDRGETKVVAKRAKLLLLAQGPDNHPPTTHEYVAGARIMAKILGRVPQLDVEVLQADGPWEEGPGKLRGADGVFLFLSQGAKWIHEEPRRLEAFAQLAAGGGGLSVLHWGMGTQEANHVAGFVKLFGGCHGGPDRKYRELETEARPASPRHEISSGLGPFKVRDEFYYQLKFVAAEQTLRPVLIAEIDGRAETVAWAWDRGDGGRSFGFSGGHFHRNWELAEYRRLVAQGILWTMKLPIPAEGLSVDITADDLKLPANAN